mgnify:CR=1 FL=1
MTNLPDSLFTKEGNRFVKNWRTLLFIKIAPLFCKEGAGGDLNDAKYTMRLK